VGRKTRFTLMTPNRKLQLGSPSTTLYWPHGLKNELGFCAPCVWHSTQLWRGDHGAL
jgi:hypothetical protein